MVQRKGKAMYGFATNKTIRRFDITTAKNSFGTVYDQYLEAQLEETKHEPVMEDIKQTKLAERKRQLKCQAPQYESLFEQPELDQRMTKLQKDVRRKFIQGVCTNEDGKQKVIYKYKG